MDDSVLAALSLAVAVGRRRPDILGGPVPLSEVWVRATRVVEAMGKPTCGQDCQMAKFDPFLSLDCARVEGGGRNPRQRKGSNFAA